MEAFSLLKYWRGGGGLASAGDACVNARAGAGGATTIVTAVASHQAVDTDDDDDDDGPFFDLEFAVPDEDEAEEEVEDSEQEKELDNSEEEEEVENENKKENDDVLSEFSSDDLTDQGVAMSPSDGLFFKGRLVPIEPTSSLDSKPPQFPVSLRKSATKFRVFLLRLKRSKLSPSEKTESTRKQETSQEENNNTITKSKFFTVKFKVEEVPLVSMFTRDNSKSQKQQQSNEETISSEEKKFAKDVMQKYLKKVKPLYVRVSRRYGEKLRLSGQLNLGSLKPPTPPSTMEKKASVEKSTADENWDVSQATGKSQKQGNIPAGLRVVCKHLGKSRSASSAVAAAPPAPVVSQRRDDSLLQQQDGIQGAILHCKRSFNGSRDSESSPLPRSVSDPSQEKKSIDSSRKPE